MRVNESSKSASRWSMIKHVISREWYECCQSSYHDTWLLFKTFNLICRWLKQRKKKIFISWICERRWLRQLKKMFFLLMFRDFWYSYIHRKFDVFIRKTSSHSLIECLIRSHAAVVWSTFFEQQITKRNQLNNQQRRHFLCLSDRAWNEKKKKKDREWMKEKRKWMKKKRKRHSNILNKWLRFLLDSISFRVVFALTFLFNKFELMFRNFWYNYIHKKSDVFIKKTFSHSLIECLIRSHVAVVWSTLFEQQITKKNQLNSQQRRHFHTFKHRRHDNATIKKNEKTTILRTLKLTKNAKNELFIDVHI